MLKTIIVPLLLPFFFNNAESVGLLYPRASETRQTVSLDGMWDFVLEDLNVTKKNDWHKINFRTANNAEVIRMAVPASYNDVTVHAKVRDHVGIVWYQRDFFIPRSWEGQRVLIRFGSVSRGANVYINGNLSVSHQIGHLPFDTDISSIVSYGEKNILTVSVDNRLLNTTIPQGTIEVLGNGRIKQTYPMDFFNFAGIDRPVILYTTPKTYIDDITVVTDIDGTNGFVNYTIALEGTETVTVKVTLFDKKGSEIVSDTTLNSSLFVQNAKFWWPYLMDPSPGYLYSLQVQLLDSSENLVDKYVLPNIGIRTVTWNANSVQINNKPIYLRGFGRHEDYNIKGRGLDLPTILRDQNLIKWIGANSFRTSHYPYADEIMDLADELGIMVIDESPAIYTNNFSDELLENHKQSLTELIQRDKNRPSVIIWSASHEPNVTSTEAEDYYREIVSHIKNLDKSRPVTIVNSVPANNEYSGQFIDIAACDIYLGWTSNTADLDIISNKILETTRSWHEVFNIPVIVTEYGADALAGFHVLPSLIWSEEFQEEFLATYFQAFDQLREEGFLVGEMISTFADFRTMQSFYIVGGNKKGIFSKNRQPKASAHYMRKRYWTLAQTLDGAEVPDDLENYISSAKQY